MVAEEDIADLTLVAEYSGEVMTLSCLQETEADDIMDLLRTGNFTQICLQYIVPSNRC